MMKFISKIWAKHFYLIRGQHVSSSRN